MTHCLNRTFMELKPREGSFIFGLTNRLNRTFMELKRVVYIAARVFSQRLNRTFMELKHTYVNSQKMQLCHVLIVPLWN